MPLQTRKPTGKPTWPLLLITGPEKVGKSWAAAVASASEHVGRTLWVGVGEDDPDYLGALPGQRMELVIHDGTYRGILGALTAAAAEPMENGHPNMLVLDSGTKLWDLLKGMAQAEANKRRGNSDGEAVINMDLWNLAKQRWDHCISVLREHQGPSVVTARLDVVTLIEDGAPVKDRRGRIMKVEKIQAEKNLPFDATAIVKLRAAGGVADVSGVKAVEFPTDDEGVRSYEPGQFTVERLWTDLGVVGKGATVGPRSHVATHVEDTLPAQRLALLNEIAALSDGLGKPRKEVAEAWADLWNEQINATENLDGLVDFRDGLKEQADAAAAKAGEPVKA